MQRITSELEKKSAKLDNLAAVTSSLIEEQELFNKRIEELEPPETVTRRYVHIAGSSSARVEKKVKLSAFAWKLAKVKAILEDDIACGIIKRCTALDPSRMLTELKEALEEAARRHECTLAALEDNQAAYKTAVSSIKAKRSKKHEEDVAKLNKKIADTERAIKLCTHGGKIDRYSCKVGCIRRIAQVEALKSELSSAKRALENATFSDEQTAALDIKTQKSDMRLAKADYETLKMALLNDTLQKAVYGTNEQIDMQVKENKKEMAVLLVECNKLKMLSENLDIAPSNVVQDIAEADINKSLADVFDYSLEKLEAKREKLIEKLEAEREKSVQKKEKKELEKLLAAERAHELELAKIRQKKITETKIDTDEKKTTASTIVIEDTAHDN